MTLKTLRLDAAWHDESFGIKFDLSNASFDWERTRFLKGPFIKKIRKFRLEKLQSSLTITQWIDASSSCGWSHLKARRLVDKIVSKRHLHNMFQSIKKTRFHWTLRFCHIFNRVRKYCFTLLQTLRYRHGPHSVHQICVGFWRPVCCYCLCLRIHLIGTIFPMNCSKNPDFSATVIHCSL